MLDVPFGRTVASDGRVIYESTDGSELQVHSVPAVGPASANVRLDTANHSQFGIWVTPDGAWVAYRGGSDANPVTFAVPAAGPADANVQLSLGSPVSGIVTLSPDSVRAVWLWDVDPPGQGSLWSTPIADPQGVFASDRINGPEEPGNPRISANSQRVVYRVISPPDFQHDRYNVPIDGEGDRYNLTESLDVSFIVEILPTASANRVVFVAGESNSFHLCSARLVPGIVPSPLR